MGLVALFPHFAGLRLVRHELLDDELVLELVSQATSACCPDCRRRSRRIHSRYTRRVADHPLGGRCVTIHLQVRRFFCHRSTCPRTTFAEQAPGLVARYARRSVPLQAEVQDIGLTLGGRPGERFAARRTIAISRTTLLRQVRALPDPAGTTPRVLGIDEFALRRGRTYGCLLVDLEAHEPVDLLPERSAEAVVTWLREHEEVAIICRDRCSIFADGATRGAPAAVQVVDRFHLLRNLGEAIEPVIARHHICLQDESTAAGEPDSPEQPGALPSPAVVPVPAVLPPRPTTSQQARHAAVQALVARGLSLSDIARTLDLDRKTVRRYARAATATEAASPHRLRRSRLDPFKDYLQQRW